MGLASLPGYPHLVPQEPPTMRDAVVFYLNGQRTEVGDARVVRTLSEFVRDERGFVGTKVVCAEGDCGACSVLIGRPAKEGGRLGREGKRLAYLAIDACIAMVYQLDGCHVVTVEGLCEGKSESLSPVQQAMVDCHGSQCGFCTPGFVTTLQGLVEQQVEEGVAMDAETLRYGLSGNLCRCTGYEQILEAGRSIKNAQPLADRYDAAPMLADFAKLASEPVMIKTMDGIVTRRIFLPTTIEEAARFKADHPGARLISGATDIGVLRNHGRMDPEMVIGLRNLIGFDFITITDDTLICGAGATWDSIEAAVQDLVPDFGRVLSRFGSPQIRNMATIGGNIANASPIADSLPFLYATDSQVELTSVRGKRLVAIDKFYRGYKQLDLAEDELITAIHTPIPKKGERLKLFKISKRRDMDISTVTAGFWIRLEKERIAEARFAIGGCGPTIIRCHKAEAEVVDQPLTEETFRAAGRLARNEVTPITDVRASAEYRLQLTENLFVKAFREWEEELKESPSPTLGGGARGGG